MVLPMINTAPNPGALQASPGWQLGPSLYGVQELSLPPHKLWDLEHPGSPFQNSGSSTPEIGEESKLMP